MRHQTGLRNRNRTGRSTYSIKHKNRLADSYGTYSGGKMVTGERINGTIISMPLPSMEVRSNG